MFLSTYGQGNQICATISPVMAQTESKNTALDALEHELVIASTNYQFAVEHGASADELKAYGERVESLSRQISSIENDLKSSDKDLERVS